MGTATVGTESDRVIKDRYIVVFDKDASETDVQSGRDAAKRDGARVHYQYSKALKGFAATLPQKAVDHLRRNPHVSYLESDQLVTVSATQSPATWGLDRIDQRSLPLSNSYTYTATGSGVTAYVIDTGIRASHREFTGRVTSGYTAINDGRGTNDCNGHGTHVAGTIGGTTYGVAKAVRLVPVRVLDCTGSGTTSGIITGIDWITAKVTKPAVANMSIGGPASLALDSAVTNSIASGVTYAVAAGNDNQDACSVSPARTSAAITVGATTNTDARASFSNYGSCLDLFAPGASITSAGYASDTATATMSGTSMATPHVAGVVALYLQGNSSATPATVQNAILAAGTRMVVKDRGTGSPDTLLYAPLSGAGTPALVDCPALTETYAGSLSGPGTVEYQPNGSYYLVATSGTHRGCLTGPADADYDLYLYKWTGAGWTTVAAGTSNTPTENLTYTGTAGYYLWEIRSYSGSGPYTFRIQRP